MMHSATLDLVRSIFAAWERGDYGSAEWAHPGIEFVIADGPSPGRWTGLAGMAEGFRDLANAWEQYRVRADEYQELDDERLTDLMVTIAFYNGLVRLLETMQVDVEEDYLRYLKEFPLPRS